MSIIIINNRSISQTSWTLKYAHAENICAADAAAGGGHCRYGLHTTYLNIHVDTNACRRVLLFVHGLECGVSGALWFAMIVHIHIYNTAHDLPLPIYPHNAHMHKVCNAACSSSSMPAAQQASKQQQKSTTMKQMSRILPQLPPQLRLRGGALPLDILGLSLCFSLSLSLQTHWVWWSHIITREMWFKFWLLNECRWHPQVTGATACQRGAGITQRRRIKTQTQAHRHTRTHTSHTHSRTHAQTQTNTHMSTHTHTHTHTNTYKHTHTHTHTQHLL